MDTYQGPGGGGGGGGYYDIFEQHRLSLFLGFEILILNNFLGFQENDYYFWVYRFLGITLGVFCKLDCFEGSFLILTILGS